MSESERFEILVLGSGAGGKLLAWHMAQSGRRTAVVERRWIGGSCPNVNCMPSKNEIHSAKVASLVRHGAEYGATEAGTLRPGNSRSSFRKSCARRSNPRGRSQVTST
jgi:pyruvate/2-oxoglutarate dehydrogenase complex dihydrolipoamide dehydrogenase (E3) component